MHIRDFYRDQMAYTLERLHIEMNYCLTCFDWFIEEK